MRKIVHIDMDAFYASVDQRDFPELRGKPLAVGGSPDGRGVVAAASYEARRYGVRSAMPSRQALQLCPDLLFTRPRFDVYKQVSEQIRAIFHRYTDMIEPLSLDEAFLDVTEDKQGIGSAIDVATAIKKAIWEELHLTASAGVSVNKFVAKIASDYRKPDGLTFIGPSKIVPFLETLPIEKFFGIGKVTAQKMKGRGIHFGSDLKRLTEQELVRDFGKSGSFFYRMVRGEDHRPVQPHRMVKSICVEDTFETNLSSREELLKELQILCVKLGERLRAKSVQGRTVGLKIRFSDFIQLTRSITHAYYVDQSTEIFEQAKQLFDRIDLEDKKIRLLGVSMSNFYHQDMQKMTARQLTLF
ncbi:DNA polymerase IV [Sphingobacterium sp. SGG-5]|nr:DNA polymerase IV [Sphingobacterium sp. SGG-5]NGM62266.1 DNA polymerase IV [Sphingobacterium sp. SGG-5]